MQVVTAAITLLSNELLMQQGRAAGRNCLLLSLTKLVMDHYFQVVSARYTVP